MELACANACGDIVQAIQALKESRPKASKDLRTRLTKLISNLRNFQIYCESVGISYPFHRAQLQVLDFYTTLFAEPDNCRFTATNGVRPAFLAIAVDDKLSAKLEYVQLGRIKVPRLFNGLWQMSSPAWGAASNLKQNETLTTLVRSGLVATDMADHYVSSII